MRSNYDDLMGLDMYDDGMEGIVPSMAEAQEQLIAGGSSALAILFAAWGMPRIPLPNSITNEDGKADAAGVWKPENIHRLRAALAVVASMFGANYLMRFNRDAAMAVLGGVGGLGIAQIIDSYLEADKTTGKRLLTIGTPLGDYGYNANALSAGDEALLTAYSRDTGTLSALELTQVSAARGAFSGFSGPVVTDEQLMGAVVQAETLGAYNPYLA